MCDHCGCDSPSGPGSAHGDQRHKTVAIEADVLAHNRSLAEDFRQTLTADGKRAINIIGSPGCGKTELCVALLPELISSIPCQVVVGDLATDNDAVRIARTGAEVYQVETGNACHLSVADVEHALSHLDSPSGSLVVVENVGNLVCPSMFDLGESMRLVCLSVTEGIDKPLKYPVSFREANVAVITKIDLAPHVDFDLEECRKMIETIHPGIPVLVTSARTGDGMSELAQQVLKLF